jgi:hypothetical protein
MPEPTIDPVTGKPVAPAAPDPNAPKTIAVPEAEWTAVKTKLDVFEKMGFGMQRPAQPAAPTGPTLADRVKEYDTKIAAIDAKIDDAVKDGKPVSQLMRERDALTSARLRAQIKSEDIDPALSAGVQTIDQLSSEVTRGRMKYYDIVKDDFEASLNTLSPEQRMNPKVRQIMYEAAVGKNVDKITAAQQEEILRKATQDGGANGAPPDGGNSRQHGAADTGIPKPEKVLSPAALASIRGVGKSVDEYYKGRGYKGGWTEYYEKHKAHFGDESAAA